jgi:aspartate 1-decarboxylase
MLRELLIGKLHNATITEANLHYSGSITIDTELMEAAGMVENEKVHVFNINTGARFETYVIRGKPGSRVIGLNGAAARLGAVGDKLIILCYGYFSEDEIPDYTAKIIVLDKENNIEKILKK